MSESKRRRKSSDIAILGGPTADGEGAHVLRIRDGSLSTGELRPVKEGDPITHKEVVRLRPIDPEHRICEVEVMHAPQAPHAPHASDPARPEAATPAPSEATPKRRARIATPSYRKNWSAIFETKAKRRAKDSWSVN